MHDDHLQVAMAAAVGAAAVVEVAIIESSLIDCWTFHSVTSTVSRLVYLPSS